MDEKISLRALEDYSDDYASKVTASFFSAKERITGPEILKLCDVHQVNLFVVRELLQAWKHEAHKLRSPYFDYTHEAVSVALARFQTLLSNHISISRESFQPLLKKAVHQTLYLILDPYDFYADTLDRAQGGALKIEELKDEIRYVKINKLPLERLLRTFDEKKITSLTGNEAFALLDGILEEVNFHPEDIESYVAQFSAVVLLDLEKLYDVKVPAPPPPVPASTERRNTPKVQKIEEPLPPVEEPIAAAPKKVVQGNLYEQQFGKSSSSTLVEDFQKRKKIKDTLTINQKFMFTKILFNGDFELFSSAVDRLDSLDNLEQAKTYLENNYSEWNKESEEYLEFYEMVEKRFAS